MASEWREQALGQVIDIKHGFAFKGEFIHDDPHGDVLLTPGNFAIGGGFKADKLKYYDGPVPKEFVLREGDLLVTMTDLSKQADTLGYPAFVPSSADSRRYLHNQRLGKIVLKDRKSLDIRFLHYLMCGQDYRHEVLASATGTTVKHTSPERIKRYRFKCPSLPEQRAIGHILGTLDDRIELTRRVNKTLDGIARATFKSWFVDFDPVRAKMEGREPSGMGATTAEVFPDRLTNTGLGDVPERWKEGRVGDLVSLSREAINPLDTPSELFDHYSIPAFDEGSRPIRQRGEEIKSSKFLLRKDCVLLSRLNPRIPRVWLPVPGNDVSSICSTEFAVAVPLLPFTTEFIYGLFKSLEFQEALATLVTGTSGSHQRVKPPDLLQMSVIVPERSAVQAFTSLTQPLLAKLRQNIAESETLAALRDTLLPKLISGEIQIKDAEKMAGATH